VLAISPAFDVHPRNVTKAQEIAAPEAGCSFHPSYFPFLSFLHQLLRLRHNNTL
jgi:hypothetical protein